MNEVVRKKDINHNRRSPVKNSLCISLLISLTCILTLAERIESGSIALEGGNPLLRVKRQQLGSPSAQTGSSTVSAGGGSGQSNQGANSASLSPSTEGNLQDGSQEEKVGDEAVSSFKCDFGSSDAPDLCKFKILESESLSSRGLSTWSHGSGKLALYQGGPLVDASDRNDTAGGYIFYETSNTYMTPAPFSNQSYSSANYHTNLYDSHQPAPLARNHAATASSHQRYDQTNSNEYSIISTQTFVKSAPQRANEPENYHNHHHHQQQLISNARPVPAAISMGPSFVSPNLTAPGPAGMCLSFQYAIQGLSAEELRIFVNDHKTTRSRMIWSSSESAVNNWTRGEVLYSATNIHSLTFSAPSSSNSITKDNQQRKFRGYIALDEININKHDPTGQSEGACKGHCNFDGDLCGWTNAENGQEDDFDWSFGRGSDNLFTGPSRDYVSSTNNELTGSYLHTDSSYPRRPGDRAILVSPMFQPTPMNDAMCMRLAVHMFGSGIGSLVIKLRYADESSSQPVAPQQPGSGAAPQPGPATGDSGGKPGSNDLIIWEMSGDAGNSWHQAQTSVSSAKSPFQVIIEGVIGENHLGDIAIDDISFSSGPCPTSPPVASKNYGDCTFEQSMCYWRNPDVDIHLDDLNWIRSADEQSIHGPNFDHTLKKRSGSYLKLENTFREPKSGTRAFLLSPIFQPKAQGNVQCLSFYYYMFMRSISSSGPNLGTIRVYLASNNELVPIWRLTNPISSPNWKHGRASLSTALVDGQPTALTKLFQIAFEGIWGDAPGGAIALDDITIFDGACDILPQEARSVPGECTFDVDMCSWINKTTDSMVMIMNNMDSTDSSKSPFLQSVNTASGYTSSRLMNNQATNSKSKVGWQLATVDSRPVNLQDHTYKAPIGYVYVDVLDSMAQHTIYILQSSETNVQSGQQVTQCLSFWFAAFGRQETNQLSVYLTQASAPPATPDDSSGPQPVAPPRSNQQTSVAQAPGNNQAGLSPSSLAVSSAATNVALSSVGSASAETAESENSNAWRLVDGKVMWTLTLKNVTEVNRRKWQYGQVMLKVDSNYIVRFIALSTDGGFALDDISYYDGPCETRPALAKIQREEDTDTVAPVAPAKP